MVRNLDAAVDHGFFRLLTDPDDDDRDAAKLIDVAAEAVLIGIPEAPLGFLGHGGDDWLIVSAVVQRARLLHAERRGEELNGLAKAIGGRVGEVMAKVFG